MHTSRDSWIGSLFRLSFCPVSMAVGIASSLAAGVVAGAPRKRVDHEMPAAAA